MLDSTFLDRVSRLTEVRLLERRREFPAELARLASSLSARGLFHSGVHVEQSRALHRRELEARAIIAWETVVRVHRILGAATAPSLRDDFRALVSSRIDADFTELNGSFLSGAKRFGGQMRVADLAEAREQVTAKHDVEIDLYVDSLRPANDGAPVPAPTYNFYGSVGAVQTGAHAVANTVQNLGSDDRAALAAALELVGQALDAATSLPDRQRSELLDMTTEAKAQLQSDSPNNTKLLTIFTVLAATVQAIPSAEPAYQALKSALLPLGITLP
jgi:hypothetical protein